MCESCENEEAAWDALLRETEENVRLFTDDKMSEYVRDKHFSQGVPIFYIDPDYPDQLIEEHADGTFIRTPFKNS